ncbi:MAG: replicative DNA helicase [Leptolyngbyaceae cyanobacterium CSU_1_3]|nr:replicative DNA helicase [Leptolyngbyaceae cyanobacterium CSU_1_3]
MVQELNFQPFHDRIPPQNIDAEEAILGGILLDPEAISRVLDILTPEAFYLSAHQELYRAALTLQNQGSPTDLMSVTTWLQDRGLLEKVGGQTKLVDLVDRTVSAVNIDQYAQLVVDKYLRRKLIGVGQQISQLGHETAKDLENVLDDAEQRVFSITQVRPNQGLTATADILAKTFADIEQRSVSKAVPGLACGFYDLDTMTQGFQRSDLVIVAGRPSMGKCLAHDAEILLADGSVATIADLYHCQQASLLTLAPNWKFQITQPSAFVDDGIKPIFRVTTRLGRTVETTLPHPYLTIAGWQPLSMLKVGDRIAVPRRLAVFGTQTLCPSEIERLALSLVGNRADEKTVPALIFRLERSQIALFLNCLFAADGWAIGQSHVGYSTVSKRLASQIQHLLLRFGIVAVLQSKDCRSGWQLEITDERSIQTFRLEIGILSQDVSEIGIFGSENSEVQSKTVTTQRCQKSVGTAIAPGCLLTLPTATQSEPIQNLAIGDIYWDQIVSIEFLGEKQVYDLTIPETHNFVANDVCVHNTAFSLGLASNIAIQHKLPVAIFSLEMSKEQIIQRLLSKESRIESSRLRSGRIGHKEWESLGHAISRLSEVQVFVDDTPNISLNEMRSRSRRLQAEKGGVLGLILIDYLQLMEGSGSENRVQELARITRSLKALARELNVPIIALSQLSRSVEARADKRPMMSDLRESGCLTGDSLVSLADSDTPVPIRDLVGRLSFSVWALNETTLELEKAIVSRAFSTGIKPVFRLTTRLGRTICATGNHKFLTISGWKRLDELGTCDRLAVPKFSLPSVREEELALCGTRSHPQGVNYERFNYNPLKDNPSISSTQVALQQPSRSEVYWDEIVAIVPNGVEEVFDLTVPGQHNFVANHLIVHNSIEQDADLIMMLYRDDYYNPDSPDRGIAEVNIVKHRNGPTGCVKLLFEPQFTEFRNLASPNRT